VNKANEYIKSNFFSLHILKIVIFILMIIAIWKNDWTGVFGCIIGIILSFIPSILHKNFNITLPWILDTLIAFALFLHIGGVILNAYHIIPFYDSLTHFVSSILVAFLAFVAIYILDKYWKGLHMNKYAMAFVVVIFTMAMGVVWEFFEWTTDLLFQTNEQWGLFDTMKDLLIDTIAGIFIAIIGVNLIKKGKFQILTSNLGEQINTKIFKNKKNRK
jgi:hypothetical protein